MPGAKSQPPLPPGSEPRESLRTCGWWSKPFWIPAGRFGEFTHSVWARISAPPISEPFCLGDWDVHWGDGF